MHDDCAMAAMHLVNIGLLNGSQQDLKASSPVNFAHTKTTFMVQL